MHEALPQEGGSEAGYPAENASIREALAADIEKVNGAGRHA